MFLPLVLFLSSCNKKTVTEPDPITTTKSVSPLITPSQMPITSQPLPPPSSTNEAIVANPTPSAIIPNLYATPVEHIISFVNPKDQAEIVYVSEGEFIMGINDSIHNNPERRVYLDAFWIYKTEVTNAQFGRFVANTNYRTDREYAGTSMIWSMHGGGPSEGAYWKKPGGPSTTIEGKLGYPVVHVSWNDAVAYCEWAGARLPTEAEWEKAARSGDGRLFPWGNNDESTYICSTATYYCKTTGAINPVGRYALGASPYGALDMSGNVAEWVWDFYADDYHNTSSSRNPTGSNEGDTHIFRGSEGAPSGLSTDIVTRSDGYPDEASQLLGFRCASSGPDLSSIAPKLTSTAQAAPTATATTTPSVTPPSTRVISVGTIEKVFIPPGEFTMGSESGEIDERPQHQVFVDGFYIDRHETTNAMYELCVHAGYCAPPRDASSSTRSHYFGNPAYDNHPVIHVTWHMAQDYCEWRQERLPTEAEWEKAARGTEARHFPWNNDIEPNCDLLNYKSCDVGDTLPVKSFFENTNTYGIYDMAGNVWEWVGSIYSDYPYNPTDGREDLNIEANRVFRGGSWSSPTERVTTTFRSWDDPNNAYNFLGFRCASSTPK